MTKEINGIRVPESGDAFGLTQAFEDFAEDVGTAASESGAAAGAEAATDYASSLDDTKVKTVLELEGGEARALLMASTADAIKSGETNPANAVDARINTLVPAASATTPGKVELATTDEATTGTDTTRAVTPAGLKAVADPIAATATAAQTAAATAAADINTLRVGVLAAVKEHVYGDSYTGEPGPMNTPGQEAHKLTAAALGLTSTTYGVGGFPISQVTQRVLNGNALTADGGGGTRAGAWAAGEDRLVIVDAGKNDNLYTNGLNAATKAAILHGYRAIFAALRCGVRVEQDDASIAYGGSGVTWDDHADANAYSGGVAKRAQGTVENATVTITLPGPGTYWLFGNLWDGSSGALNKTLPTAWAVTLDGDALPDWELPQVKASRAPFNWSCPTAYRVVAEGAGTHTVVLDAVGTSTWATFDCYAAEKDVHPLVIARKQVEFKSYSWGGGGGGGGSNAGVNAVNDALTTAAADFDNVYLADATGYWMPGTHIGTDNLHANDAGMAIISAADLRAAYKGIRGMLTGQGARPHPLAGYETIIFDSFNRAAGTNLGSTEVGSAAWTEVAGDWSIYSNGVGTSAAVAQGIATVDAGVADCAVSARIVVTGGSGLIFRCSDSNNYFMWDGSTLWKKQSGSIGAVGTTSAYRAAGAWFHAVLDGPTIRLYADDVLVSEFHSTFNQTVTKHGLLSANSTTTRMSHVGIRVPA